MTSSMMSTERESAFELSTQRSKESQRGMSCYLPYLCSLSDLTLNGISATEYLSCFSTFNGLDRLSHCFSVPVPESRPDPYRTADLYHRKQGRETLNIRIRGPE